MGDKMKKTNTIILITLILIIFGGIFLTRGSKNVAGTAVLENPKITIFKSSSCGCCDLYVSYMKRQGFQVETKTVEDISQIKSNYKIPSNMQSCHTSVIGDYFVEGHMPIEAINKLLKDKPDILGITLPDMPSGSPGMPGSKNSDYVVYAINKEGIDNEFIRI